MVLLFLQSQLPGYVLSNLQGLPLLTQGFENPAFCLLPHTISLKKAKMLDSIQTSYPLIAWIHYERFFPSNFFNKKFLLLIQPLYFITKTTNGSFILYDQRYLKLKNKLYKLPAVQVDLSTVFLKTVSAQDKENYFFEPQRNVPFYFKGDTSDRLTHLPYLTALQTRQYTQKKPSRPSIYLFLKNKLDDIKVKH